MSTRRKITIIIFILMVVPFFLPGKVLLAQDYDINDEALKEIVLAVGEKSIIKCPGVGDVEIGDGKIAAISLDPAREKVTITGLSEGETTLTAWHDDETKTIPLKVVSMSAEGVAREIKSILQNVVRLNTRTVGEKVLLEGELLRDEDLKKVEEVAGLYPQVINMCQKSPQIMLVYSREINRQFKLAKISGIETSPLKDTIILRGSTGEKDAKKAVEIASLIYPAIKDFTEKRVEIEKMILVESTMMEVSGSRLENIGVDWGVIGNINYRAGYDAEYGKGVDTTRATNFNVGVVSETLAAINFEEDRGRARILSNSKQVVKSGQTATFTAGGEIPIPVAQEEGVQSIEWKEYGVKFKITPRCDEQKNIETAVNTRVSSLDPATGTEQGGFNVPGIKTRENNTMVTLKEGETMVISGLVTQEMGENISRLPYLGRLPVLGTLFNSRNFQDRETNLVIFITPRLVTPSSNVLNEDKKKVEEGYQDGNN